MVLDDIITSNGLAQRRALIRFYFGSCPRGTDSVFKTWQQLKFALEFEGKLKDEEIKTA